MAMWDRRTLVAALIVVVLVAGLAGLPQAGAQGIQLELTPALTGLDAPVDIANAGDGSGRVFVVERPGRIRVATGGELQDEPYLNITDRVHTDNSEQGLLAVAFHPLFEQNGYLYVWYTALDWANTLSRFQADPTADTVDPATEEVLLALPDRAPNHNGGTLAFGPDGYLYVSTGDEGGGGDTYGNAQNVSSLFGKILRLDVDGGFPYAIPPDNPVAGSADGRPEIWAYGLRNPWRMSFDPLSDILYIGDVGQAQWEELNALELRWVTRTPNFGWNISEGRHCYEDLVSCDLRFFNLPAAEYDHDDGCAVAVGHVYRGSQSPALAGALLAGDYCSGKIWSLRRDAEGWVLTELLDSELEISTFGVDEAGEQYVADVVAGTIFHITATGAAPGPVLLWASAQLTYVGNELRLVAYGEGFTRESRITWDGQPLATTFVSATELAASLTGALPVEGSDHDVGVTGANTRLVAVYRLEPADEELETTWARTDRPVAEGVAARTWMWGPGPVTDALMEPYREAPDGSRLVQYFDKSRMELTHPDGDPSSPWYVTNGLLVVELITGREQMGDDVFRQREPARVNVAGDPDDPDGPTYATFAALLDAPSRPVGSLVTTRLARDGTTTEDPTLATFGVTVVERVQWPGIDHAIPSVFWEFMHASGVVWEGGYATDALFRDPFYATGLPIAEPYWATVRVGGTPRDVLVQCFERRCLTYTPGNPEGWQVEAGNVGQHYFVWRYGRLP